MKYTIDEILAHRLSGWLPQEWIFISTLGDLPFLKDQTQLKPTESYVGMDDLSVIVVCSKQNTQQGYAIAEKLVDARVSNLGIWVIGLPHIAEIVTCGYKRRRANRLPIDKDWQEVVSKLAVAA